MLKAPSSVLAADTFPPQLDWSVWLDRWDRMQERYLPRRRERFETIIRLIAATQSCPTAIVDLGCGSGSLTLRCLEAFPDAEVYGLDLDPTLLRLAEANTSRHAGRVRLRRTDLRDAGWTDCLPPAIDAFVSATALHWLNADQIEDVYRGAARRLGPGGILLNADHVASESVGVQRYWEEERDALGRATSDPAADEWDVFWREYLAALGGEAAATRAAAVGEWGGIEQGLPLSWHFDALRIAGFSRVDCFWRCATDAIYGGILG